VGRPTIVQRLAAELAAPKPRPQCCADAAAETGAVECDQHRQARRAQKAPAPKAARKSPA
jgi:hypothetical protein